MTCASNEITNTFSGHFELHKNNMQTAMSRKKKSDNLVMVLHSNLAHQNKENKINIERVICQKDALKKLL